MERLVRRGCPNLIGALLLVVGLSCLPAVAAQADAGQATSGEAPTPIITSSQAETPTATVGESASATPAALPEPPTPGSGANSGGESAATSAPATADTAGPQPGTPDTAQTSGTTPVPPPLSSSITTTAEPQTESVAAADAPAVADPRATIGELSCEQQEVDITLDNSRSTQPVQFAWSKSYLGPLRDPPISGGIGESFPLAAGEVRVVTAAILDDAKNSFRVDAGQGPVLATIAEASVICGDFVQATFASLDCDTLSATATLDNSHSSQAVRLVLTIEGERRPTESETVDLSAGEIATRTLRLVNNATNGMSASLTGGDGSTQTVGSAGIECGRFVEDPRVSFGKVDCRDRTVLLTLDNSRSTDSAEFLVWMFSASERDDQTVVVRAGSVRVITLNLPPDSTEILVHAVVHQEFPHIGEMLAAACPATHPTPPHPTSFPQAGPLPASFDQDSAPSLAVTGADVIPTLLLAIALAGAGVVLQLSTRHGGRRSH